jgi:hypothetical protein
MESRLYVFVVVKKCEMSRRVEVKEALSAHRFICSGARWLKWSITAISLAFSSLAATCCWRTLCRLINESICRLSQTMRPELDPYG